MLGENPPSGMIDVTLKTYYYDNVNKTKLLLCEITVPTAYEIPASETTTTTTTTMLEQTNVEATSYISEQEYPDSYSSTYMSDNQNDYEWNSPSYPPSYSSSSPDESIWDDPDIIRLAIKIILLLVFIVLAVVVRAITK